MTRRLLTAHGHRRRLEAARGLFDLEARERWVIANERRSADEWVREASVTRGTILGVHRASLLQRARQLADPSMLEDGLVPLSSLGAEALAARAIHHGPPIGALAYFGPVADLGGFKKALARTLADLRAFAIQPGALLALGPVGEDLGRWLEVYESELGQGRFADPSEIFARAIDRAPGTSGPILLLDLGPLNPLERAFLEKLIEGSTEVWATASPTDAETLALYDGLGFARESLFEEDTSALARARRWVFADTPPKGELDESFAWSSAPGEGAECVEIARSILWATEGGTRFDQIGVLLRQAELYQPLLEDALHRAGIPAYFAKGTKRPDPAGRALLLLLACAREGLPATRFAEYLSLQEVPELADGGGPPEAPAPWVEPKKDGQLVFFSASRPTVPAADAKVIHGALRAPEQWEHLLVDAAVIGGKERWVTRLAGWKKELEGQRDHLGTDDPRRAKKDAELHALETLIDFALPLIARLDALPGRATWGEWLGHLEALASAALREPTGVLSLLAELRPMSEVGPVDLAEVEAVLEPRLRFLREEPVGHRYGKVWIGTIDEAAGRSFSRVYLPGLAEGLFPKRPKEDPLLLDAKRTELQPDFAKRPRELALERRRLGLALGAAEAALFVSYPRLDMAKGRARVPSFYALDLLRALEGKLPELKTLERRAIDASAVRLGWPAPVDPQAAIDAFELDLAWFAAADPAASTGRGRYLFETDGFVGQAAKMYAGRWRRKWSSADGLWLEPAVGSLLDQERLTKRAYSASRLESFATCPYKFFLSAIQKLEPAKEQVRLEVIDPLTRGRLVAEIQFRLIRDLVDRGIKRLDAANIEVALDTLRKTIAAVEQKERDELAPAIPAVWAKGFEEIRTDLYGWLRDVASSKDAFELQYAELAFGMEGGRERDPASQKAIPAILGGYLVRGSVDLVERDPGNRTLRVVDHKTGRVPDPWPIAIGKGEYLQVLLYAQAIEASLGEPVVEGRYSYCTQRRDYEKIPIKNDEANREALKRALVTIDRALQTGQLPAAPRHGACSYCDYALVCGPGVEDRVVQKDPGPLADLLALRSTR